ncbi:MAG: ABC transporter permease [Euryarchaeota archaeon]|nr:ABC transporter permease [Euryarchaeota archaeon]
MLEAQGVVNANVSGFFSSSIFPSNWMLGSLGLLGNLTEQPGEFNFIILKDPSSSANAYLQSRGFSFQPMIGIIEFLDSGVQEIERDANWALIPSVFVIAVLAYSFLGTETVDRRHDIGIIKTVGAGKWRMLSYLLTSALIISAWGGLLGLALGIVLSYGVSTVASSMFTSVFVIKASGSLLLLSFIVTVGAGVAGAFVPSLKMTMSSPVEDLKEVAPFS